MSVLSHLDNLGSNLILTTSENSSINTSISTLKTRLGYYFNSIDENFVFGSYDRGVILPRNIDSNSDIDFIIVFNDGSEKTPQTLLTRLKNFAEYYYSTSEIHQSSPTMVLSLNHIKFELVPAYKSWGTLYIPAPSSNYQDWTSTNPSQMKTDLVNKNINNNYKIKPLVRVLKYWNVRNGKVYSSYELEQYIMGKTYFFDTNLKDYFFTAANGLPTWNLPEYKKRKVERLQSKLQEVQSYLDDNMPYTAEEKLKDELPDI